MFCSVFSLEEAKNVSKQRERHNEREREPEDLKGGGEGWDHSF